MRIALKKKRVPRRDDGPPKEREREREREKSEKESERERERDRESVGSI